MMAETRSERLGMRYLIAAFAILGLVVVFGLAAALPYLNPNFLFPVLPFSMTKILHIDTMIIWLLLAFIGAIYWLLPGEFESDLLGIRIAEVFFWVLCAAIVIVAGVFLFVQYGHANEFSLWFINQGRKYVEEPRWAAVGVVAVLLVFMYNIVATAAVTRRVTGIVWVLMLDLVPLFGMYLIAFPAITDVATDQFWWWWLVHFWVEATWEVLIGCILALALIRLLNTRRAIVETWLYIEVALVLATGVLGIGHHYFWIGTPKYWMGIGGFFSALEPLPLLGMVIHAIYDAGAHHMSTSNRPAFYWLLAEAFGNFIGAGIWGFMITLPQINLFAHGTQWTASHGHFAFWGAYGCGVIAVMYLALQKSRGALSLNGSLWKWTFAFLNAGIIGMAGSLMLSGMAQAFYERAIGGSTFSAFVATQSSPWFVEGMYTRFAFGLLFAAGYFMLVWDFVRIGRRAPVTTPAPALAET